MQNVLHIGPAFVRPSKSVRASHKVCLFKKGRPLWLHIYLFIYFPDLLTRHVCWDTKAGTHGNITSHSGKACRKSTGRGAAAHKNTRAHFLTLKNGNCVWTVPEVVSGTDEGVISFFLSSIRVSFYWWLVSSSYLRFKHRQFDFSHTLCWHANIKAMVPRPSGESTEGSY